MSTRRLAASALAATSLVMLLSPLAASGQAVPSGPSVDLSGQVRPRFEYRDPVGGGLDDFTSMRVRLAADVDAGDGLSIFIQMQDVRIWGEESNPLFDASADALDLHQGYLRFRSDAASWLTTTVGRMETNLGGERLVGAVDWVQQGQSFDGLRFDIAGDRTRWTLLAYAVRDETAPANASDEELYGAYGSIDDVGPGDLDLYWLYDRVSGAAESDEHLVGARWAFTGSMQGRLEATVDRGTRAGSDVRAFMVGARLGATALDGKLTGTVWYDYLSGDDPATSEVEVFNTLYATNHKFYGFADLFLDIPAHTGGAGLQDAAVKVGYRPDDDLRLGVDLHHFRAAEGAGLTESRFGEEIDLTIMRRVTQNLDATFGLSHVFQGDGLAEVGRLSEDMTWLYVMVNATF